MCLRNLSIQLPGSYTKLDGDFKLTNETNDGKPVWINEKDSDKVWFYRINPFYDNVTGETDYTYNWVYGDSHDLVACAPGYVDMPLFCTTYVYAGLNPSLSRYKMARPPEDGGITRWTIGSCDETLDLLPTFEPTLPTFEPNLSPTNFPTTVMQSQDQETDTTDSGMIIIIMILGALVFLLCIFGSFMIWKYKKTEKDIMQRESKYQNQSELILT